MGKETKLVICCRHILDWTVGKLIREETQLKKWAQSEAGEVLQGLAKDVGTAIKNNKRIKKEDCLKK